MKKTAALLALLLGLGSSPGSAQTDEDLINDARTPEDVLVHSMGYDRKSYSPLDEIDKSNIHRLVPIWSTSLMNQSGELAAPAIWDGVYCTPSTGAGPSPSIWRPGGRSGARRSFSKRDRGGGAASTGAGRSSTRAASSA